MKNRALLFLSKIKWFDIYISSVFLQTHLKEDGTWKQEYIFYMGDLISNYDKDDWRFKEVKNRRKQAYPIGLVYNLNFPIRYPLELLNGKKLKRLKYYYDKTYKKIYGDKKYIAG